MLRYAAIGVVLLAGAAWMAPANADVPAPGEKVKPAAPGCNCPVVHRRVHARHRRFVPPPAIAVREGPDLYNVLIPSTYDPAYDRVVVDHFRTPAVTGFDEPWRPKPAWPGVLPYRASAPDGIVQYDGLTGRYVRLAAADAARVAAPLPLPPPPKSPWWPW